MNKIKKIFLLLVLLFCVNFSRSFAATIEIVNYPTIVYPGEKTDIEIKWFELTPDPNYFIKIQLENWDAKPGFFIGYDIPTFTSNGTTVVTLDIPKEFQATAGCRFVAAVLSKTKFWSDIQAMTATKKEITVGAFLKIESYPKIVLRGELAQINLGWNKIPKSGNYKLVVQLENWDVTPSILVTSELEDFESEGNATVLVSVPKELSQASNCRFTAAFISKIKGWDDTFCVFKSTKDVSIN